MLLKAGWRALCMGLAQGLPAAAVAVIMRTVWQPLAILLLHTIGLINPVLA